jgi:hypothetical protein
MKHLKHMLATCASQGMSTAQRTPRHRCRPPLPADDRDGGTGVDAGLPRTPQAQASPGTAASLTSPSAMGKVDGGATRDGGMDRRVVRDGTRDGYEQLCLFFVETRRRSAGVL